MKKLLSPLPKRPRQGMPVSRLLAVLVLLVAAMPALALAQTSIQVTVEGIRNDVGIVRIGLYDDAAVFPDEQQYCARVFFDAQSGTLMGTFEDVEPGTYAVAVYHDEDASDSLQRNLFGKPSEGYGFSNGARAVMRDPPFEKAAFQVAAGETATQTITLKY
jgi:uncharacterized protein (DUF2141 family)